MLLKNQTSVGAAITTLIPIIKAHREAKETRWEEQAAAVFGLLKECLEHENVESRDKIQACLCIFQVMEASFSEL